MIKLKIKSVWQGKVGIHERYITQARERREGLTFIKGIDVMEIPYGSIKEKIIGKTDRPFKDRYSRNFYHLYYFQWTPDSLKQEDLFAKKIIMDEQDYKVLKAMERDGGSFVKSLAGLCRTADLNNLAKIKQTWSGYWEHYKKLANK